MSKKPMVSATLFASRIRKITDMIISKYTEFEHPVSSSPVMMPRATSQVTDRAQGYGVRTLRSSELKSIYALFAWVANEQKRSEETVQCITATRFGVDDVASLQQKDYDEVIKFLIDLRIDEMQH